MSNVTEFPQQETPAPKSADPKSEVPGLGLADLAGPLWSMLLSVPVILGAAVLLLKKQER